MPRVAEARPPAMPSTSLQHERCDRLLRAAARLGAEQGFERVQMADVAEDAGVALGTLYRYFPSKHHLFAGVLDRAVRHAAPSASDDAAGVPRGAAGVAALVTGACRAMLRRPLLARAMITSVNVVRAAEGARGDTTFRDRILVAACIDTPTGQDLRLARLVEQCTYGVLTWAAAGELSPDEAVADLELAVTRLVGGSWR